MCVYACVGGGRASPIWVHIQKKIYSASRNVTSMSTECRYNDNKLFKK